ncbi:galactokinase [Fibrivirga algicola]|uniref:Galactokinase n=1 Tax=Fibrivirga algicola TaxID=2950420 RepID=A0ABX0QIZ6_9BACT|nr:galactokinase [Fibrivirga algicola]ARK12601.1 galactokinase [Fibrella sp. ES10-3-2-2]NID12244.1 galactokinase [Fibrivirga algicola]
MQVLDTLTSTFRGTFGETPTLIQSPGRVNLIGEHTDYNEGFVLPAAIDKAIFLAVGPRSDQKLHFVSADLNSTFQGTLGDIRRSSKGWANYLLGVVDQVQKETALPGGLNVVFGGTIPIGSGLSSSAALENGVIVALNQLYKLGMERIPMALLSQRAENQFVGVQCGIMDQFASMMGRAGHVIKLDCRSLAFEYAPLAMDGFRIVLCDSRVKHSLASTEYNTRRAECEAGVAMIRAIYGDQIRSLRDVTMDMLNKHIRDQEPLLYKRCAYVVLENQRLLNGVADLEAGNIDAFGQRMFESHEGLSNWYEVSCPELDVLEDIARAHPGVLGARMMGGGFGGCTINLVREDALADFEQVIQTKYLARTGKQTLIHTCRIEDGTHVV